MDSVRRYVHLKADECRCNYRLISVRRGQQATITKSLLAEVLLNLNLILNTSCHSVKHHKCQHPIHHHFASQYCSHKIYSPYWWPPNPQLYTVNALETISIWGFILAAVVAAFFLLFLIIAFCRVGFTNTNSEFTKFCKKKIKHSRFLGLQSSCQQWEWRRKKQSDSRKCKIRKWEVTIWTHLISLQCGGRFNLPPTWPGSSGKDSQSPAGSADLDVVLDIFPALCFWLASMYFMAGLKINWY